MQSSLQMAGLCSTQREDLGSLETEHWCVQRAGHGAQGLGRCSFLLDALRERTWVWLDVKVGSSSLS